MSEIRLRGDWVLVELEPERTRTRNGVIHLGPDPIRTARVLAVGPGRLTRKKGQPIPTGLKPGDRFPFFKAATETKQGLELSLRLPEGQELVRAKDVLFVIEEGDPEITL